jgi:predicted nicotinamide N-methyase
MTDATDDNDSTYDGLNDLFTVKEYQTVTVRIPRRNGDLAIDIWQSPAACTDPDLTGQILWPVSRLLSHYIASSSSSSSLLLQEKTVLELGAGGTALPSLTAHYCGARTVIATDGNEGAVLDLLRTNIQRHQRADSSSSSSANDTASLKCRQLQWGRRQHLLDLLTDATTVDVVLAADVVQWPAVVEPLLHTVKACLWREPSTTIATSDNQQPNNRTVPIFLLGLVPRAASVASLFFRLADDLGFSVRQIPPHEYLGAHNEIPLDCREHGGRMTELYELRLRPHGHRPVLLDGGGSCDGDDGDYLVGSTFRQTTFLPC